MIDRRSIETPIEDTFTKYLTDKGKGDAGEEGAYRADAERELNRFRTPLGQCSHTTPMSPRGAAGHTHKAICRATMPASQMPKTHSLETTGDVQVINKRGNQFTAT